MNCGVSGYFANSSELMKGGQNGGWRRARPWQCSMCAMHLVQPRNLAGHGKMCLHLSMLQGLKEKFR